MFIYEDVDVKGPDLINQHFVNFGECPLPLLESAKETH